MSRSTLLGALAESFLGGEQSLEGIIARGTLTLGRSWNWLHPLASRYLDMTRGATRPRRRDVIHFLRNDAGLGTALTEHAAELRVVQWPLEPQQWQPAPAAAFWDLPRIDTVGALADWFWLDTVQLEWFADIKGFGARSEGTRLRHYHYRILPKRSGSLRLIEAPKSRLKKLQRQILEWILDSIPPHPAAHGFVKGRSIRTFVTPHIGRAVVLRMDLEDFFPSLAGARIQAFFRTLGYPEAVADRLGGLCTNAVSGSVWKEAGPDFDALSIREARSLYSRPHLPQGAPTSPALANACAYRVDCRLTGLAQSAGAEYSRYADDLAFSWAEPGGCNVERFAIHAAAILMEEGFTVHHRKTRIMRQGVRQHLAGLTTNQRMNVARADFDRLKAILTNCVRSGPESQNREAHPQFEPTWKAASLLSKRSTKAKHNACGPSSTGFNGGPKRRAASQGGWCVASDSPQ